MANGSPSPLEGVRGLQKGLKVRRSTAQSVRVGDHRYRLLSYTLAHSPKGCAVVYLRLRDYCFFVGFSLYLRLRYRLRRRSLLFYFCAISAFLGIEPHFSVFRIKTLRERD